MGSVGDQLKIGMGPAGDNSSAAENFNDFIYFLPIHPPM